MGRGPGRPPGPSESREKILEAARSLFAEKGYEGATIRGIARAAGVDPALVHHYFAGKENLFVAAMRFPFEPGEIIPKILADGPPEEVGVRLVRTFIGIWDDPDGRASILALIRSAMTNERAATMMREFVSSALLDRLAPALNIPPLRVEAALGQMIGIAMLRYVMRVEPIASASVDELVELVGPMIQRHLTA